LCRESSRFYFRPTTSALLLFFIDLSSAKRKGRPATGQPLLQGRIVPTEAKKNPSKLFWTKSYEPKKQGVKEFFVNKSLWFQ
jgi:hypothetical protein